MSVNVDNQAAVDEAVRQFKERCGSVVSQLELARLEDELWQQVRPYISASGSSAGRKQRWWDTTLGGRNAAFFRSAILARGESAQILWQYMDDKQLAPRSAFRLLKLADEGEKSLSALIAEYLAMPETTVRSDGQVYRRHRRGSARQTAGEAAPAAEPSRASARAANTADEKSDMDADDWRAVRKTFEAVVNHHIAGIAEPKRTHLRQEFKMEVDLLIESISRQIYREKNSATERLRYRDLADACQTLNVKPPRRGNPIDQKTRTEACRNYRKFARYYHPDLRGGDESYRHLLERVTRAWDIINTWASTSARTTVSDQQEGE